MLRPVVILEGTRQTNKQTKDLNTTLLVNGIMKETSIGLYAQ